MTNILLIGYRGTGKTTVGRLLAEQLDWAFVDADDEIEAAAGCSIAEIFTREGEAGFRDREARVVAELCSRKRHVISLGGGAVLRDENRAAIKRSGHVVWLTAAPEMILARVAGDANTSTRRPNLTTGGGLTEIEALLAARQPLYAEVASATIDTQERSPHEIAAEILRELSA
jgi:shikimate kinase